MVAYRRSLSSDSRSTWVNWYQSVTVCIKNPAGTVNSVYIVVEEEFVHGNFLCAHIKYGRKKILCKYCVNIVDTVHTGEKPKHFVWFVSCVLFTQRSKRQQDWSQLMNSCSGCFMDWVWVTLNWLYDIAVFCVYFIFVAIPCHLVKRVYGIDWSWELGKLILSFHSISYISFISPCQKDNCLITPSPK